MIYSFDLSDFEGGRLIATRYPDNCAVGGDWVVSARDDAQALKFAKEAALNEWAAPDIRPPLAFRVDFVDSHRLSEGEQK